MRRIHHTVSVFAVAGILGTAGLAQAANTNESRSNENSTTQPSEQASNHSRADRNSRQNAQEPRGSFWSMSSSSRLPSTSRKATSCGPPNTWLRTIRARLPRKYASVPRTWTCRRREKGKPINRIFGRCPLTCDKSPIKSLRASNNRGRKRPAVRRPTGKTENKSAAAPPLHYRRIRSSLITPSPGAACIGPTFPGRGEGRNRQAESDQGWRGSGRCGFRFKRVNGLVESAMLAELYAGDGGPRPRF